MTHATTRGFTSVGGWRRTCRRLLPALLVLTVLMPATVHGSSGPDAWRSARDVVLSQSVEIGRAARALAESGTASEVRSLRRAIGSAVRELDALEVHDCFRVWWSYVRSSYVLYDQALAGVEANDLAHVQAAMIASRYLASMAKATQVDCGAEIGPTPSRTGASPREGLPLAGAVPTFAG
jgi:hypothetical protein